MLITLYKLNSDKNTINKDLTDAKTLNIAMRGDFNFTDFKIKLSRVNYDNSFNYIYFNDLDRYYFVDDTVNLNNKVIELTLNCDVLETFKDDILKCNARVQRNIRNGDFYDGIIEQNINTTVSKYKSNKGLIDGEKTVILSTVGV